MIKLYMSEYNHSLWMVLPNGKIWYGDPWGLWRRSGFTYDYILSHDFDLVGEL